MVWLGAHEFSSRWLESNGIRQHYLDEGDGPPVLLLHGNPSWCFYWRALVTELRTTHRCIVPDHIGMGLSSRPPESDYAYTLKSRVDDLEALMTHLVGQGAPAAGWTLVVHDWGGPIGLAWAARHPELVSRLVVLNSAAFPSPWSSRIPLTLRVPLWAIKKSRLVDWLFLRHNVFARGAARFGMRRAMPALVREGYLRPYGTPEDRLAILRFVQDIPLSPADRAWTELLAAEHATKLLVNRPVFVGWGGRDPVFRRAFLDEWRRRFPGAVCRVYPDGGHYVLEDQPELIREITAFLGTAA